MIERDHPAAVNLAEQSGVDSVLRLAAALQPVAADQLRRVRPQHLDADVEEMQSPAPRGGAAIVADVVIERALPVALELAARDEHHVRVLEAGHIAAEIAAVPRRLHLGDHLPDRLLLRGRIVSRCPRAGGEEEDEEESGSAHAPLT